MKLPKQALQQLEEIRIRTNTDTLLISGGREYSLRDGDEITAEVLEEILNRLLDYSYYAYEEELSRGYITIEGGHRVGICGRVTLENGQVHLIKDVSSLNIRRSREITGASRSFWERCFLLQRLRLKAFQMQGFLPVAGTKRAL